MALSSPQRIALTVAFFGIPAFVLGVVAENKKVQPYVSLSLSLLVKVLNSLHIQADFH
jgi:hypothetical protein